jgi:hypothetical protein
MQAQNQRLHVSANDKSDDMKVTVYEELELLW